MLPSFRLFVTSELTSALLENQSQIKALHFLRSMSRALP
jgi:hypothetical protein